MAWHYSVNNTLATYSLNLWQLFTVMMEAGWTDVADSDGVSAYTPGQHGTITSGNTGAGGLNNNTSWIVLQSPAGAGGPQILFQNAAGVPGSLWGSGDIAWIGIYSPAAGFVGGSPSMTVAPTASDGYGFLQYIPQGSQWFNYHTTEGSTRYSAAANDAAPYAFWAASWPIGGGSPGSTTEGCIFYDGVVNGAATEAQDSDPHVLYCDGDGAGFTAGAIVQPYVPSNGQGPGTIGMQPSVGTMAGATGVPFPWNTPSSGLITDPTNGLDMVRPQEFYFLNGFYKGQTPNILWEMTGTTGSPRPLGYLLQLVNPGDYIVIDQLALPWPGVAPLI
jgi:hypothetical protein